MRTRQTRIVTPGEPIPLKHRSKRKPPVEPRKTKQQTRLNPVPTNLNKSTSFMLGPSLIWLVGWLFWAKRLFETVFQSISSRLPKRGRKRRERIDESKNVQTTPTRTYCERSRPLPYCIQIVGRPDTGSLPSIIAPPDHPRAHH